MRLELTYITHNEKLEIMTCIPEKLAIEVVKSQIVKRREFTDTRSRNLFMDELNRLGYSRSHGVPKTMKKSRGYFSK